MKRLLVAGLALALTLGACTTAETPHPAPGAGGGGAIQPPGGQPDELPREGAPTAAAAIVAEADARLTRVEAAYGEAKALTAPWLPMMPDAWRVRVESAQTAVERALIRARLAVTTADRLLAVRAAADALAQFRFVSGS